MSASLDVISEIGKNQIANYMGAMVVLSLFLLQREKSKIWSVLIIFSIVMHAAALLYTFSRSALLGVVFAVLLFQFASRRISIKGLFSLKILVMVVFFIGFILFFSTNDFYVQFISNLESIITFQDKDESTSISVRSELITSGLNIFYTFPFFGAGPGYFVNSFAVASHNSYIQLLAETGIIGFLSYVSIIMVPLLFWKKEVLSSSIKPVILFLMFSLLFQNALDSILIFFFLGLLCVNKEKSSSILEYKQGA
mgnify:FL=1